MDNVGDYEQNEASALTEAELLALQENLARHRGSHLKLAGFLIL